MHRAGHHLLGGRRPLSLSRGRLGSKATLTAILIGVRRLLLIGGAILATALAQPAGAQDDWSITRPSGSPAGPRRPSRPRGPRVAAPAPSAPAASPDRNDVLIERYR